MTLRYPLVLASASPRRAELLRQLGLSADVDPADIDESYPPALPAVEVPLYLARRKAAAVAARRASGQLVLAADSVVVHRGEVLNKPRDLAEARATLHRLCGEVHTVITGVCLLRTVATRYDTAGAFSTATDVTLLAATAGEIEYYLDTQPPLDRAGSYGIQDWIGWAKCVRVEGSYGNVMGLPTAEVYRELSRFGSVGEGGGQA